MEQNKRAIAAATAAADAAVVAAHVARAVTRQKSHGSGAMLGSGPEGHAAVKIQTFFRGYRARNALKGVVKFQADVKGYLVRKQAAATPHSFEAQMSRAQASARLERSVGGGGEGDNTSSLGFATRMAKPSLRTLKGLVKFQARVRGYLVRKQAAATLHIFEAHMRRAPASARLEILGGGGGGGDNTCRLAARRWTRIRLVVTFLCFLKRKIRNREIEDSQASKVMKLLELEENDVRIVGIHGRDGIGKTALAKIVYDQISPRFYACSFLAQIEETKQQPGGVEYLHTKLIFDILKREHEAAFAFPEVGLLKELFRNMKVLIVLDDVESGSLLEEFVGAKLDWFGCGSRIIVTSKDSSVLQGFVARGMAHTYNVSPMDDNRAFDLFWQYAMGMSYKLHPNIEIANKIVKAAKGLPLLIKVFGSFLHGKGQEEWMKFKDLVQQFQEDYQKILSIVYEALDQKQKLMYLDIACFLPDVDCRIASYMWQDYDRPHDEIDILHRRSLIKMEENKIGMHSMLRCLARKIIYQGFHPGIRDRFYIPAIPHGTKKRKRGADHLNTIMAGFEILPSMTFLSLGNTNVGGRFADALLNIRWLHWQGCPPDFEAISIHLGNLVILDLSWSKVTESWGGWKGIKMERLKVLNVTGCADLLVTPSFSYYPNLEILFLERCSRLVHLDPSINDLKLLVTLNLRFCSELTMLPEEMDGMNALEELLIDGTSIRELPASIGKLVQLQTLSATNCFSLVRIPGSVCELQALSLLALDNAKILELPESIGDLGELRRLSLRECRGLGKLPESIGKLAGSLVELDISGTGISKLPESTKNLQSLKLLKMDSCFLRELPHYIGELINLEEVDASWCRSLEGVIPSHISKLHRLRELRLRGTRISSLPSEIQFMPSLQTLDLLHCDLLKELPPLPSSLVDLYVNPGLTQNM